MKTINYSITALIIIVTLLTFSSCQKEEAEVATNFSIRYEFESSNYFDAVIHWTNEDGGINGSSIVDAEWTQVEPSVFTYSFNTNETLNLFYSAQNTNSLSEVKIKLYVDGALVQSAEANSYLEAIISYQL